MDAVVEILKGLDYSPLYVSLKTGIVATIFSFFPKKVFDAYYFDTDVER